jgi:predicted AlkP superfamily phosphohydrolase/phosphomutase
MKSNLLIAGFLSLCLFFATSTSAAPDKKFLILGIDGMDYHLLTRMLAEGSLPNFDKLRHEGDFRPLLSSIPPQSPVAWSNFITGMDPGGHGIFDFIHRIPEDFLPYLSTSRTVPPSRIISLGRYRFPLKSEEIQLLRQGRPFWEFLEAEGIPTTIISIPANFPPDESSSRSLSGMGTPDILGSYGSFTYISSDPADKDKKITGGVVHSVVPQNGAVRSFIPGPVNTLVAEHPQTQADIEVYVDPENEVAKIVVQDQELLLAKGDWSKFIPVKFEMIPWLVEVSGIVRFYLKEVHPFIKVYISPVNIDPSDPAMPISHPKDYARELYDHIGYFYTQGMAEDTKALDNGILTEAEFHDQTQLVLQERLKMLDYELNRFDEGLLFFYFSTIDLSSHMYWRFINKDHPDLVKEEYKDSRTVLPDIYRQMDEILGSVMNRLGDHTILMVMSDHGFADFRREIHVNTWLAKEGYLQLLPDSSPEDEFFSSVDWSHTRAYALGINGLYINLQGREKNGIVQPGEEFSKLVDEIAAKLEAFIDPMNGSRVIRKAYKKGETFHGPRTKIAPDIVLGFYRGYRTSDQSALGEFPLEIITDNQRKWSGDHCMDYREVPGVLLMNKRIKSEAPALYDLAPTILKEFGIKPPSEMLGKPIY